MFTSVALCELIKLVTAVHCLCLYACIQVQRLANLLAQRGGKLSPQFYSHIRYNKSSNSSSNSNSSGSSSAISLNAGASSSAANASSNGAISGGATTVQAAAASGSSSSGNDAAVAAHQNEDYMPR
jgi:hypothetical protein